MCLLDYEVRIKWINTSLKFSKEIIKVVLINISKLRLIFTVSSTWWSIPDWSIILQHLPSAGQWQTMSLLQDHNVRHYDVHKNKIWSDPHEANPTYRFTQKRFHVIIISSRVLIIWNLFCNYLKKWMCVNMGMFVNPDNLAFQAALNARIYVDKSGILNYTNSVLGSTDAFICKLRTLQRKTTMPTLLGNTSK